jgi:hypothetical protein
MGMVARKGMLKGRCKLLALVKLGIVPQRVFRPCEFGHHLDQALPSRDVVVVICWLDSERSADSYLICHSRFDVCRSREVLGVTANVVLGGVLIHTNIIDSHLSRKKSVEAGVTGC